jgi:cell division transport system permease protein
LVEYLENLEISLLSIDGIEEVSYGKIWVTEYSKLSKFISFSSLFIMFSLLLSIAFIIGNTVKTLLENRRKEIHIMSILGATDKTIFMPFYWNIALLILFGFMTSVILTKIFQFIIQNMFVQHLGLLGIEITFPGFLPLGILFLLVGIFSVLGTHLHLLRISKSRYSYDI